jgi:hypothetical protein
MMGRGPGFDGEDEGVEVGKLGGLEKAQIRKRQGVKTRRAGVPNDIVSFFLVGKKDADFIRVRCKIMHGPMLIRRPRLNKRFAGRIKEKSEPSRRENEARENERLQLSIGNGRREGSARFWDIRRAESLP